MISLLLSLPVGAGLTWGTEHVVRAGLTLWPEPRPLAELRFVDAEGQTLNLANFRGKVVLLNVWATWCVPCREEMPTLDRLQERLGGADFQVVALSVDQDGLAVVRDFYREVGIQRLEIFVDEKMHAIQVLGAFGLPATLLLDREGRELGRKLGAAEWDAPEVEAYLREVINSTKRQP
ncbi:hypothetical protein Pres01_40620 [Metapseudomonas resinovorans]|nr:hypothetical protein Pres01_40620 [Pseudomonas resinovorans]